MKLYFDSLDLVEIKSFSLLLQHSNPHPYRRGECSWAGALLPLLVFLLLQRRRSLLFFYSFLDESDDLGAEFFVKHASRTGGWLKRLRLSLSGPSWAHDEESGESCERCGRPGKPCSIHDPTISGKWITLTLCDQCHGAIRQMEVRACKWFRRYCAPRNQQLPFSRPIRPKPAVLLEMRT